MREMSGLIFQAKELHYDSATMLMKLKAEMQVGSCLMVTLIASRLGLAVLQTFSLPGVTRCFHRSTQVGYIISCDLFISLG